MPKNTWKSNFLNFLIEPTSENINVQDRSRNIKQHNKKKSIEFSNQLKFSHYTLSENSVTVDKSLDRFKGLLNVQWMGYYTLEQ